MIEISLTVPRTVGMVVFVQGSSELQLAWIAALVSPARQPPSKDGGSWLYQRAQAERAGPPGQRLEDGRPKGQNTAQQWFGSRQPYPSGGKPKTATASSPSSCSHEDKRHAPRTRQLCLPAQNFLHPSGEVNPISDLAQVFVMKGVFCGVQLVNLRLVVLVQELL